MKISFEKIKNNLNSMPINTWFTMFVSLSALFLVLMNLFAMRPIGWGNFMLTNAGLLLIAPVLVLQNVITEVWGKETALKVTVFIIMCQVLIVLLSELTILLPTNNREAADGWASVFGSQWRIASSSIIAFTVGSVLNILVFEKIRVKSRDIQNWYKWLYIFAAFVSTLIAQFFDSTLFMVLAFAPMGLSTFELPWQDIWTSVVVGTAVQLLLEITIVVVIAVHLAKWLKQKKRGTDKTEPPQN